MSELLITDDPELPTINGSRRSQFGHYHTSFCMRVRNVEPSSVSHLWGADADNLFEFGTVVGICDSSFFVHFFPFICFISTWSAGSLLPPRTDEPGMAKPSSAYCCLRYDPCNDESMLIPIGDDTNRTYSCDLTVTAHPKRQRVPSFGLTTSAWVTRVVSLRASAFVPLVCIP